MDLTARARFYESLATAVEAGLTLPQALSAAGAHDRSGLLAYLGAEVGRGHQLSAVLRSHEDHFPPSEVAIIEIGERSGRLAAALKRLAAHGARASAFRRKVLGSLAYPLVLIHGAIFLPTLPLFVQGGASAYAGMVSKLLLAVYSLAFLLWLLFRLAPLESLLLRAPAIGAFLRSRAVADYAFVLEAMVSSGAPIPESLKTAAQSVDLGSLRAAGMQVALRVRGGASLSRALADEKQAFGTEFVELMHTGEVSGKLDLMLQQAEKDARQQAERKALVLAVVLAAMGLVMAGLLVGWVVVDFWRGYADQLEAVSRRALLP